MTTDGTRTPAAQTPADQQPTENLGTTAVLTAPEPQSQSQPQPQYESRSEPQPPRAQAAYGTPPAPRVATPAPSTPFSLTSLILGVTSVFFGLTVIAPVAGLVFGILGLRREPAGRTLAIWGIVLNAAMTGLALLVLVGLLLFGLLIPVIAVVSGSGDYR